MPADAGSRLDIETDSWLEAFDVRVDDGSRDFFQVVRNVGGHHAIIRRDGPARPGWHPIGPPAPLADCESRLAALAATDPVSSRPRDEGRSRPGMGIETDAGIGATLGASFRLQARRSLDAVALSDGAAHTTYAELDARSDALAARLVVAGIGPEVGVGLGLERGTALIVALLAVTKAGGFYVPLDPEYPSERLAYVMADAGIAALIVDARMAPRVVGACPSAVRIVDLNDGTDDGPVDSGKAADGPQAAGPVSGNLAYVIYTSGSTGRPKGVAVEHGAVLRLFRQTDPWFAFGPGDVWTFFHSIAFDFSVWEIWGALLHGGRLVIVPERIARAPDAFLALLAREGVTVLNQTPSAFEQLCAADADLPGPQLPLALRLIVFGGEALNPRRLAKWYARRGSRTRLVNMYGITETTVHVTYQALTAEMAACETGSPIGRPIPDLRLHILDEAMMPVPQGEPGEIYVGGPGLARGYLGRPGLTALRFVPDPFGDGERLYRTGDLALQRPDGSFQHLGRCDHQVKIRGFRIELGEVEAALLAVPEVRKASVSVGGQENAKRLVAHVVGCPPVTAVALRRSLKTILPEYMIPQDIVWCDDFPLTINGKLDRDALARRRPPPTPAVGERRGSETERLLCRIWRETLGVEQVDIDTNFFDLGGSSVEMVRTQSALRDHGTNLPMVTLFEFPRIRDLAAFIDAGAMGCAPSQSWPARQREALERRRRIGAVS